MQFLDNYNYFGYLKGANEVNRQYFQQAVLLCLQKALYYAGICSYAASYAQNYAGIIHQGLMGSAYRKIPFATFFNYPTVRPLML